MNEELKELARKQCELKYKIEDLIQQELDIEKLIRSKIDQLSTEEVKKESWYQKTLKRMLNK